MYKILYFQRLVIVKQFKTAHDFSNCIPAFIECHCLSVSEFLLLLVPWVAL